MKKYLSNTGLEGFERYLRNQNINSFEKYSKELQYATFFSWLDTLKLHIYPNYISDGKWGYKVNYWDNEIDTNPRYNTFPDRDSATLSAILKANEILNSKDNNQIYIGNTYLEETTGKQYLIINRVHEDFEEYLIATEITTGTKYRFKLWMVKECLEIAEWIILS